MNGQPVISVRGEATLEVEPEIAVVGVTIQARDRDRETVLHRLADRNRQITNLIKGYGEAVEKLESGPVSVRPELKEKRAGERVAGYLANASTTVTIRDFTVLGDLIVSLADGQTGGRSAGPGRQPAARRTRRNRRPLSWTWNRKGRPSAPRSTPASR